jgi:hypothetical protein
MKILLFLFASIFATAQTKKIDFFGTGLLVNNSNEYQAGEINSLRNDKNSLIWADAPPKFMLDMLVNSFQSKIKEKKVTELKSQDLNIKLLKTSWKGKLSQYKKENNDTITNFVQLFGNFKTKDRLVIIVYKTMKQETFRIPACFDFLVK